MNPSHPDKRATPIDYDRIAPDYDTHRQGRGPYFGELLRLARAADAERVLELGAGTGNNTAPFLEDLPCRLVALDRSRGMLARHAAKGIPATRVNASAVALPFADGAFDFLFATYMLHHIGDLDALARECHRVLDGGTAAFVTVSHDFIRRHPMNAWFPSFAAVDCARFQDIPAIEAALRRAGFAEVHATDVESPPRPIDADYVGRVADRFISTYDLLPPEEFAEGVARLRAEVAKHGALPNPIVREATVVYAQA